MSQSDTATPDAWEDSLDVSDIEDLPEDDPADDPEPEDEPADDPEEDVSPDDDTAPPATATDPETPAATDPAAPAAPVTADPAAPSTPSAEPFRFRVDGQEVAPEGAVVLDGVIAMPVEVFDRRVRPYLADRNQWRKREETFRRQIAELDPNRNVEVLKAREMAKVFDDLEKRGQEGGAEAVYAWAAELLDKLPTLKLQAERDAYKARLQPHEQRLSEEERQRVVTETLPQLQEGLKTNIATVLQAPEYAGADLTVDDLYEELWEIGQTPDAVFHQLNAEEAAQYGGKEGELMVRLDVIHRFAKRLATKVKKERERLRDVSAARRANDTVTAPAKTPPAVASKGSPAPAGKRREYRSREEWEQSLDED